ncbi:M14 family metallopeptidase [Haloimpatiens sp. FM7330]|uniref:M14 family metallopeptidase n=1 Tax=Haloimpatiens sp. FM7330 TaxID=3298610 RepID=UPI0036412627
MRILKPGSKGSDVMEIQALLKKMGYNPGTIDGIYGPKTTMAVKQFQSRFGLFPTGIIEQNTYKILEKYLLGYDIYVIQKGDNLYDIANKYGTSLQSILTANPDVDPYNLQLGQEIAVPYSYDIVDTNIDYTYEIMERDIKGLKVKYPFIDIGVAGNSVLGKKLYYLKLGRGPNKVFYNASHHSLEWITSVVLMKFIENYAKAYVQNRKLRGYNIREVFNNSSIYIVPMVNPDGIELVLDGLKRNNPYYKDLIKWNNGSTDFSKNWQANTRGVDLNHNYNASWQESKDAEKEYGVYGPGPTRYSGTFPESEPETKAVVNFTKNNDFRLVLAYHSQGRVIYWNYKNMAPPEAKVIGEKFADVSGYTLSQTYGIASYAGYKDWFIKDYRRPGYTIEVGLGKNPLPISQFDTIYNNNEELLILASQV